MTALQIIFYVCLLLLLHSYLFYPLLIKILSRNKKQNEQIFNINDPNLPSISILLAAYNEELVIADKIEHSFNTNYPLHKIEFIIGSDASTDKTNEIINSYKAKYKELSLVEFQGRSGKSKIINTLVKQASNEILILTDANVLFTESTIYEMVKHFQNEKICLVGGNIINSQFKKEGISIQEEKYISRENIIKYREGILWGSMVGAFGGCYAIRKRNYADVPPNFFMDDFYITMNVLESGGKAINELKAKCYEDVSNKISEEFRRKVRISIGNFQNLFRYWKLVFPLTSGISFSFISHKILRWIGPFFLLGVFISNMLLFNENDFFKITMFGQLGLLLIPILDTILKRLKVNLNLFRFITHFYFMNGALLIGFFKFLKGVKSNIWQPTQRFQ